MYDRDREHVIDRREMLRVKVKSLAEEARIIRKERHKTFGLLAWELNTHRQQTLRKAARAAHLAYGLLKGRTHEQVERRVRDAYATPVVEVRRLLKKYGRGSKWGLYLERDRLVYKPVVTSEEASKAA